MKEGYEGIVLAWTMLAIALPLIVLAKWLFSWEATMPKVGRFVTDPRAGAKFMGFASDRIFACDLDSLKGQSVLAWLTCGAEAGRLAATPLGAAVEFVKDAETLTELKTRCAALMSGV